MVWHRRLADGIAHLPREERLAALAAHDVDCSNGAECQYEIGNGSRYVRIARAMVARLEQIGALRRTEGDTSQDGPANYPCL